MNTFRIDINTEELLDAAAGPEVHTRLLATLFEVTDAVRNKWVEYANGAPLPNGRTVPAYLRQEYAESITWTITGPLSTVVFSRLPQAGLIETGWPARDLKRMLDTSHKVRISKNGNRYLVIPFRHGAFNKQHEARGVTSTGLLMMPRSVHSLARGMTHSTVAASSSRHVASRISNREPLRAASRRYVWGARLPPGLAPKLADHHRTDPYAGMVKFQNSNRGGSKETSYLTFRVMSDRSRGWVVPPQPGLKVAETVADQMRPIATRVMAAALTGKTE